MTRRIPSPSKKQRIRRGPQPIPRSAEPWGNAPQLQRRRGLRLDAMSLIVPPYPPPRYTKDEPEVSAWLRRGDQPPDYDSFGRVKYHYLANQQNTNGDYGLYRVDLAPQAGGAGPPFHRAMSEAFFVLSGAMKLYDGTDWKDGNQGDFLYVPPGGVHGFRNEADEPASILMLFAPGAPREHYFEGLAQLGELTDDERRDWFIANDNYFV